MSIAGDVDISRMSTAGDIDISRVSTIGGVDVSRMSTKTKCQKKGVEESEVLAAAECWQQESDISRVST